MINQLCRMAQTYQIKSLKYMIHISKMLQNDHFEERKKVFVVASEATPQNDDVER